MKKLLVKTTAAFGFAVFALNPIVVQASDGMRKEMGNMKMDSMEKNSSKGRSLTMNEAEVKAVDKASKSITLKHGPIKSKTVEMSPMTMSFPVQNPSLLSSVRVGDKVKFTVENVKDQATVTALEVQN